MKNEKREKIILQNMRRKERREKETRNRKEVKVKRKRREMGNKYRK